MNGELQPRLYLSYSEIVHPAPKQFETSQIAAGTFKILDHMNSLNFSQLQLFSVCTEKVLGFKLPVVVL